MVVELELALIERFKIFNRAVPRVDWRGGGSLIGGGGGGHAPSRAP